MGDGASVTGGYFQIVRKVVNCKGPHQASYFSTADGGDDTSEDDNGMWCYCQIAKDGSMNHVLYYTKMIIRHA